MDANHPRRSSPLPAPTPTRLTSSQPFARYPSPTRRAGFDPGIAEGEEEDEQEKEEAEAEVEEEDDGSGDGDDAEDKIYYHDETQHEMWDRRPAIPTGPEDGRSAEPLLKEGTGEQRGRGVTSYEGIRETDERTRRRHLFRSRSPSSVDAASLATRKKYVVAGFFLLLSLVSFVVQTETAVYIQSELGWKKPYLMLYFTHGSWTLLWPVQILILKLRKPKQPWPAFMKSHFHNLRTTSRMIMANSVHLSPSQSRANPVWFMLRRIVIITSALTVAGSTWYVAVNLTTASDLTAIYNCSAFFAYVFSVFLLKEPIRKDKVFSVIVACIGVLIVAYGDAAKAEAGHENEAENRLWGNIIIGVGSVMYGFYEVLYKKAACPPEGISPSRSIIYANTVGTGLGLTTLCVLWIPIPILHFTGLEPFSFPTGRAGVYMLISVLANATFSGSFLVLISLTSPVLSSVAALLTIFLVAIVDWMVTGKPLSFAAILGGCVICGAFFLLAWSTWREMVDERRKKEEDLVGSGSESGAEEEV